MQSKNLGLIVYTKPINDNNLYIKILSDQDDIVSGLVYGGNSFKKKSTYQIGYFIEFNQLSKNINSINSINGEIAPPFVGSIFNDKYKSQSVFAAISILNISLYEGQRINNLFTSFKNLIDYINTKHHWMAEYCSWYFYFLKLIGYEIDHNNNSNMKYFNINSLDFHIRYTNNESILFPHDLLSNKKIVSYQSIKSFFIIFESVYIKSHLNSFNDKMPINFINFKKLILKQLAQLNNE